MPETPLWDELTRSEQRLLIRLFGGGSLRNQNPEDVEGLCRRGLVDDEQNLSVPGLLALTLVCAGNKRTLCVARESFGRPAKRKNPARGGI
jgi:hypothetical protein